MRAGIERGLLRRLHRCSIGPGDRGVTSSAICAQAWRLAGPCSVLPRQNRPFLETAVNGMV